MLIIISPAKTMKETPLPAGVTHTLPLFTAKSKCLVEELKKYNTRELGELMKINPELAQLNFERFRQWSLPFTPQNAFPALLCYRGEVFNGLDADGFNAEDFSYAQDHLVILSGLYGMLRPLDLIRPYRLEMGLKTAPCGKKNLYEYWKEDITSALRNALDRQGDNVLINLASNEYFKAIDINKLAAVVVTPQFKEYKNGSYKMITVYAKKARGLMSRFIVKNRLTGIEQIKLFDEEGYFYNEHLTLDELHPVFTR